MTGFGLKLLGLCVAAWLIAACGFTPLYTKESRVSAHLSEIAVATIYNNEGVELRNLLIDRLNASGTPSAPLYQLDVNVNVKSNKLGIRKDDVATRAQLITIAKYKLLDVQTGTVLLNETAQSINSYNILDSQFTTEVTQADARARGLEALADQIQTRISLYFKGLSD